MPDRTKLKVGDRIRLLRVPPGDLAQRERELKEGREGAGMTADAIEQILLLDPVVTITQIDEYGYPWFEYELPDAIGDLHYHSIAILEDESWDWHEGTS
jgi:hypothetical protein